MRRLVVWALIILAVAVAASPMFAGTVIVLGASQDAALMGGGGWNNSSLGAWQWLMMSPDGGTSSLGLVMFDLSGVPSGATVNSATLTLYQSSNAQRGGVAVDLYRVTSAWNEATVTYTTRPSWNPAVVSSLAIGDGSAGLFRSWNVTSSVQGWVNGTYANDGLLLMRNPDATLWPDFSSKESTTAADRPSLSVDYSSPTGTPEPSMLLLVGSGAALLLLRKRF